MQPETRQTRIADSIVMEMDQEAETTSRLFDVIPEDKLSWRPHPKARASTAHARRRLRARSRRWWRNS